MELLAPLFHGKLDQKKQTTDLKGRRSKGIKPPTVHKTLESDEIILESQWLKKELPRQNQIHSTWAPLS